MTRKLFIDTDIFIDFFKKKPWAKRLFSNKDNDVYYSSITLKELFRGAQSNADEEKILKLLHFHTEVRINSRIAEKALSLQNDYPLLMRNDSLIAASALYRNLPLVTRNLKDFSLITELEVIDGEKF